MERTAGIESSAKMMSAVSIAMRARKSMVTMRVPSWVVKKRSVRRETGWMRLIQ